MQTKRFGWAQYDYCTSSGYHDCVYSIPCVRRPNCELLNKSNIFAIRKGLLLLGELDRYEHCSI